MSPSDQVATRPFEPSALAPIEQIDPAEMIVDALGDALLPANERTGEAGADALRILNRAYAHPDNEKRKQRMTSYHGIALMRDQPSIVLAPLVVDPVYRIILRPANNVSLTETIHELISAPPTTPTLVFLTQKRGASLVDMRVSYPSDILWICRSGEAPTALSRRHYRQIHDWHDAGVLKTVRAFARLLHRRNIVQNPARIDADLDKLAAELNRPMGDLWRSVRLINDETWAWANRKLAL